MAQKKDENLISYIKKPMARYSFYCLGLAFFGLLFFIGGMGMSVKTQGNTPLYGVALCFSSLLFSICSVRYGTLSFKEKDRNYVLAKIGTVVSGALLILWLVTILIGIKGL